MICFVGVWLYRFVKVLLLYRFTIFTKVIPMIQKKQRIHLSKSDEMRIDIITLKIFIMYDCKKLLAIEAITATISLFSLSLNWLWSCFW